MASSHTRTVSLINVGIVRFDARCEHNCPEDMAQRGVTSVLIVTTPPTRRLCDPLIQGFRDRRISVTVWDDIAGEPTFAEFAEVLGVARAAGIDGVVGLGGGSAMDVAKLVAALYGGTQDIRDVVGVDVLAARALPLACIPTTAGTGSEVTPIAILGDEDDDLKKGVVSPHLVPDFAYLDAKLTVTMPPEVTASTGIDALTHCIEAYTNRFTHPIVDIFALAGIGLIAANIERACRDGTDLTARAAMLRASYCGGMCLGPVNTAAVHALAYPLGGEFHVAHGVANSILLPHVLRFNLPAAPTRFAAIAHAMGVPDSGDVMADAAAGIEHVATLSARCGIPAGMSHFGISANAIPHMAAAAMTVTRLLDRNPRALTEADAHAIYKAAL
jgi:alcohol dehydrogenase class IV